MVYAVLSLSLSMSLVILAVLLLSPLWDGRFSAKGKYIVWLILAVRLLIPISFSLPNTPVTLTAPDAILSQISPGAPPVGLENGTGIQQDIDTSSMLTKPSGISFEMLLTFIWGAGVLVFLLFYIVNYLAFLRKIRPFLTPYQTQCALPVYQCEKIASPMLVGFLKPTILIPKIDYTPEELEIILAHETAHHRRKDLWFKLLLVAANAVHWFNPMVYFMVRQANRDLELACDGFVVKNQNLEYRKSYSLTLLKSMQQGRSPYLSTNLSLNARAAKKRFENVLNTRPKKIGAIGIAVVAVAAICLGAFFTLSPSTTDYSYEQLSPLLGQTRDEVFSGLGLSASDGEETQNGSSTDFILTEPVSIEQNQYQLRLGFRNNILVQFDYFTQNPEGAYTYAKEILQQMQNAYGEPTTYPSLPNRLSQTTQMPPSDTEVYEQWDANLPAPVTEALGYPGQVFHLQLRLHTADNMGRVSIGYILQRTSLQ